MKILGLGLIAFVLPASLFVGFIIKCKLQDRKKKRFSEKDLISIQELDKMLYDVDWERVDREAYHADDIDYE
jgi:hypothetical protein